ncbi:unnamed protein product, partial [Hapterophycus canaliculatus]
MERSLRSTAKSYMFRNTFGQSQNLRQDRVRELRGIIANEREAKERDGDEQQEEKSREGADQVRKAGEKGENIRK